MKKIISLFIPLLPILSIYKSPIPKVDLGTFFASFFFVLIMLELNKKSSNGIIIYKKKPVNMLLLYCFYILAVSFTIIFIGYLNVALITLLSRVLKMILFICLTYVCINYNIFDYKYSLSFYKKIIIASCIMVIFQTFSFYFLKRNIYGVIMPLILQGEYHYVDYSSMSLQYLYRPCAFFLEPSGMTAYFSLYLAILLNKKPEKNNILLAIFITFCMFLSTSGQAYLYSGILWLLFFLKCLKKHLTKKTLLFIFFLIIMMPFLIVKLYNVDIIYKSIQRIVDGSASGGNAVLSRTMSISYFIALPLLYKIFGVGFGNPVPNVYFNSFSYTLYCTGILGLFIVLLFFAKSFFRYNKKNLVLYWLISTFFSTTFVASNICFYLPFLVYDETNG